MGKISAEGAAQEGLRLLAIRRRWVALFILVALVILVTGGAYYQNELRRIRQLKYEELAAIAELKAEQIARWRREQLSDVHRLAASPLMRRAVEAWLHDPDVLGLRADLEERFRLDREMGAYADVLLVSPQGEILLSLLAEPAPLAPEERRALEEALTSGKAVLSDFYRCSLGRLHLDAIAPLLDGQGRPMAAIVLRHNAVDILYPLIQSWPIPSRSAETILVRAEGEEVLYLNDLRFWPDAALNLRFPLSRTDLPAVQAVLGKRGLFEGRDYRGVKVLADLQPIPNSPWFMVAKVDQDEIFVEARYRAGVTVSLALLAILLAALAITYGYRWRQAWLYRELYRHEREWREAEAQFRTILYSIGDAVITVDNAGRIKQMNAEAERLTGWAEAEAQGRPVEEVFRLLNEETRTTVESPVQRVLREGIVVELANHSLLVAKDGSERPIADSGAPIRDESGATLGVVLVFRDQTKERTQQRTLQETNARLQALLRAAPIGIGIVSPPPERRLLELNDAICQMLGYSREELLGRSARVLYPSDEDFNFVGRVKYAQIHERGIGTVETRWQRRDGAILNVLLSSAFLDPANPEAGTTFTALDITERKRMEETLHKSEARYRLLVETANEGIWTMDADHATTYVNQAMAAMLGYTPEEMIGHKVEEFLFPQDLPLHEEHMRRRHAGEDEIYERRFRRRDGSELWTLVSARALKDEQGRFAGSFGMFTDITERKRAEEALRESNARLQALFRAAPAGIGVVSWPPERRIRQVNERFCQMVGRTIEELVGQNTRLLYPTDEDYDFVGRTLYSQLEAQGIGAVETRWQRRDGSVLNVLLSAAPLDPADVRAGIAVMALDITEHKQAEEERGRLEAQLRQAQKMEAVGRLAGGVAHDFNNMLGVILGYASMALGRLSPTDPLYGDIQEIINAAKRSADLTQRLLAFSRRQTISPRVLDLNTQMRGMERLLRRIIGEDIELEFKLAPELWPVRLDPSQIDQIVANLAVNSRDAMPAGGQLTVETANVTFDQAYLRTHPWVKAGDYVLLAVSDTGCGMDKETLEHLFEPFFTTKPEGKGTGLGLATVYGIVKQNDGFIDVYSEPGRGTTVKIYFPRYRGEEKPQPVEARPETPLKGRETILLVEDEDALRQLVRRLLERLGYTVLEAANPAEALEVCAKHDEAIHLLLTDVVMPQMSGKELVERSRALKPGLKALFMSGYTAEVIGPRGMLEKGIHFLQKPFSPEALAHKVREALEN